MRPWSVCSPSSSPQASPLTMFVALACLVSMIPAQALAKGGKSPEQAFKGQIVVSKSRFPSKFKSDSAFVTHMKKVDTKVIHADESGQWSFEYMVFAKAPVGTVQAAVTFYDITSGQKRMINTFNFYMQDPKQKIINGYASLSAEKNFEPNKKYLMVFSKGFGQPALASTELVLYPSK